MATTRCYLDTRAAKSENIAPLKMAINHRGKTALINLELKIRPNQWDEKLQTVINHPNKMQINYLISKKRLEIEGAFLKLMEEERINLMTAQEIKDFIIGKDKRKRNIEKNLFIYRFEKFMSRKKSGTYKIYERTLKHIRQFAVNADRLRFEDITRDWICDFEAFLAETQTKNGRNIHLRNIRAVFNDAIDNDVTSFYPFRKFKIKPVATRKRSLSVEQLRILFNYPIETWQEKHLDIFKLIFFLQGINIADLCNLKFMTSEGRIEFNRAKTNRFYSIKVEPEAMEIINKYRGKNYLIDIKDIYQHHEDYLKRMNMALKKIGTSEKVKVPTRTQRTKTITRITPLFPDITTYWARHTWATIAASLDIPKETIAAALGHGGNTVTDIYIDFDQRKVDEANRKVIDYVLEKGNQ